MLDEEVAKVYKGKKIPKGASRYDPGLEVFLNRLLECRNLTSNDHFAELIHHAIYPSLFRYRRCCDYPQR